MQWTLTSPGQREQRLTGVTLLYFGPTPAGSRRHLRNRNSMCACTRGGLRCSGKLTGVRQQTLKRLTSFPLEYHSLAILATAPLFFPGWPQLRRLRRDVLVSNTGNPRIVLARWTNGVLQIPRTLCPRRDKHPAVPVRDRPRSPSHGLQSEYHKLRRRPLRAR